MNGLDYAVVTLSAVGAIYGLSRGVVRMATSVASFGAALYCASRFYPRAAALAGEALAVTPTMAAVIGYVIVFGIVFAVIEAFGSVLIRLVRVVHIRWADRVAGSIVGAGVAAAVSGLAVMLLAALLPANAPLLTGSTLAPRLLAYNDTLLRYVPAEVKDAYRVKRRQLMDFSLLKASPEKPQEPPGEGATSPP